MVGSVLKPRQTKQLPASRRAWRNRLLDWFEREGWDHPWRQTRDPYAVLVSEVMLQQTRLATVLKRGHYQRFLRAFPDVQTLASATDEPLLKAWEGLGYYRRARMLRQTAQAVVDQHEGGFPSALEDLLRLPGIGRYTAGALRAFAFERPAVLVDGNVSRLLSRVFDQKLEIVSGEGIRWAWDMAAQLACDRRPREYHSALMELGQRHCTPRTPACMNCPIASFCATRSPQVLPRKRPRKALTHVEESAIWLRDAQGRLLMQRESGARRTGLWKLPLRERERIEDLPLVAEQDYAITRYRVSLQVRELSEAHPAAGVGKHEQWIAPERLDELAMAAPFRKVVERLLAEG